MAYTRGSVEMNGKVTLSPQVFRLDQHHRMYRRRRSWQDITVDIVFTYVVPAAVLVFALACWAIIFWAGAAVLRAIGR